MKIPEKIMIGGYEVSVELVTSKAISRCGDWTPWYHRIRINVDDTSEDKQAEAFLHEIVEACNDFGGLKLEHAQITGLSTLLFAAIRQNKLTFLKD